MAKATMEQLVATLRRMKGTPLDAGEAGEDLTWRLLDQAGVSWFSVEQVLGTKSERLRQVGAKRVDFVVGWEGACVLLDSKCYNPQERGADGSLTFALTESEVSELTATAGEFGLEVAVIFWDRSTQAARFVVERVSRLRDPCEIDGKPAFAATFAPAEISTARLFG